MGKGRGAGSKGKRRQGEARAERGQAIAKAASSGSIGPQATATLPTSLISRWIGGIPGSQRKNQKEGQEDQGEVKELGRTPPLHPTPCRHSSGSILGCVLVKFEADFGVSFRL